MTRAWFFLRPDETVALREKPARGYGFAIFALLAVPLVAVLVAALVAPTVAPEVALVARLVAGIALALLVAAALFAWRRTVTTEYAITDSRIYARTGQLFVRVHFTTHDKVTDIHYHQGPLDRAFGVSSVRFVTAGGDLRVSGVADALRAKSLAESAREAFIERLLARAGVAGRARAEAGVPSAAQAPARAIAASSLPALDAPRPPYLKAGDRMLWLGRPTLRAAAPAVLPVALVAFFLFPAAGAGGGPAGGLVVLLAAPVLALGLGLAVLRLKRTEYVVTDRGVYARSGVVGTTVAQLTFDKITDITYHQDLVGRVLGYATLSVNTAGSATAPVVMTGLEKALDVKALVERARGAALREEDA